MLALLIGGTAIHATAATTPSPGLRIVQPDFSALENPGSARRISKHLLLTLPLPEGGETVFELSDSGTLPPALAQRYPHIRSMKGLDAHGRRIRLDQSENGVRAIVSDQDGTWLVQPKDKDVTAGSSAASVYVSFRERAAPASLRNSPFHLQWQETTGKLTPASQSTARHQTPASDNSHRDYRIAVATTSAYSQRFGGTVNGSLASVVEVLNRVNAVFERDLGIHLTLVEDNDKIIFTSPASDPYIPPPGNDDFDFTRQQNANTLNQVIGNANFDIGHLFDIAEGGGVIDAAACQDNIKAHAGSGLTPGTDAGLSTERFIRVVTHEIGHQVGASHTFNGCMRSEEEGETAYEPGSGSTIMSYAGECFSVTENPPRLNLLHNLQDLKDMYFHAKNIEQVRSFLAGPGASCGVRRDNPRQPPVIKSPSRKTPLIIPAHTPFALTAHARSPHDDALLTYTWEQTDLGPEEDEQAALSDRGIGPIFRSYPPAFQGTRVFPDMRIVLGEEMPGPGEIYPATSRELNFRLTVRDNLDMNASTSYIDRKIEVLDTEQPFAVTDPTATTTWKGRRKQYVRWNVAGTDQPPISCKYVRINLSIDGGHTYLPKPLIATAPNLGFAEVSIPRWRQDVTTARVRVSCNDNVFFAVSPGNFRISK